MYCHHDHLHHHNHDYRLQVREGVNLPMLMFSSSIGSRTTARSSSLSSSSTLSPTVDDLLTYENIFIQVKAFFIYESSLWSMDRQTRVCINQDQNHKIQIKHGRNLLNIHPHTYGKRQKNRRMKKGQSKHWMLEKKKQKEKLCWNIQWWRCHVL